MLRRRDTARRTPEADGSEGRRRRRLLQGLLIGAAAVGVPALANARLARRSRRLDVPLWGRAQGYAWSYGEVAFQRLGEGRPVVLVHSLGPGHDAEEWRGAAEVLARTHRVYAVDLLGWGRSEKPALAYDGELYVQLLADFLADVVRERAVVAGAGLAAAYAVQLAVDFGERVRAVALVGPSGLILHGDEPDLGGALVHRLLRVPVLGTSILNLVTRQAALTQHLRQDLYAAPERVSAALVAHAYRSSHQPGSHRALAAYFCGDLDHRVDEALARLATPAWLAWGREATAPPVETADLWLRQLPDARLEVLEEAGSLPHAEAPARFAAACKRFLDGLPA